MFKFFRRKTDQITTPQSETDFLDQKIIAIHKSSKTTFNFTRPLNEKLRQKWKWYYNWHLKPRAHKVHWAVLFGYMIFIATLVLTNFTGRVEKAEAYTCTWTGAAGTSWSTPENWSGCNNVAPLSTDSVQFTSGSNPSSIDIAAVTNLTINGYTGVITAGTNLTISGAYSQSSGTFNLGTYTLQINKSSGAGDGFILSGGVFDGQTGNLDINYSNFNQTNGTFTAPSTSFTINRDFTISGGTHNNTGNITFDSSTVSQTSTITYSGNTVPGTVIVNKADTASDFTAAANTTINLGNGATSSVKGSTITNNGTINAGTGTWTLRDVYTSTVSTLVNNGVINVTGAWATNTTTGTMNVTNNTGATITIGDTLNLGKSTKGTTLTNAGTITINGASWTQSGNVNNNSGGSISHNGSVWDLNNNFSLTNSSGATIAYSGTSITSEGSFNQSGTLVMTGKTLTFDGTWDPTVTANGALGGTVIINKPSGGGVTVAVNTIINLGANPTSNIYNSLTNNGTINATGTWTSNHGVDNSSTGAINIASWSTTYPLTNSGSVTLGSGSAWTAWDITNSGTINHNGSTWQTTGNLTNNANASITYGGASLNILKNLVQNGTLSLTGKIVFYDGGASGKNSGLSGSAPITCTVELNKSSTGYLILNSDVTISGDFIRTDGAVNNPGSARVLTIQGNFSQSTSDTFGGANLSLVLSGGGSQSITQNAGSISSLVTINKSGNSVSLSTNLSLGGGAGFTVTAGKFDLNGKVLSTAGHLRIQSGGILRNVGTEDMTGFTTDYSAGSTLEYSSTSGTNSIRNLDYTEINLTINGNGGTYTLPANLACATLTVSVGVLQQGTRTISATGISQTGGTFTGGNANITDTGDLSLTGGSFASTSAILYVSGNTSQTAGNTFSANSGTVEFNKATSTQTLSFAGALNAATHSGLGTLQVTGNSIDIDGNFTNSAGTVDLNGKTILAGANWTNSANFNASTADSTVNFDGGSTQTLITGGTGNNYYFNNLTHSGAGTLQLSTNDLDINGNFTNSSGIFNANGRSITAAGNWSNAAIFTAGSGLVTLDGAGDQAISGNSTFNNLTATTSAARNLNFTAGTTQTVSGTLTITGTDASHLLGLKSTTDWNLDATNASISYADIAYCTALNHSLASITSKDSGNNINWTLVVSMAINIPDSAKVSQSLDNIPTTIELRDFSGSPTSSFVGDVTLSITSGEGTISPTNISHADFSSGSWNGQIHIDTIGDKTVRASLSGDILFATDTINMLPSDIGSFSFTGLPASTSTHALFTGDVTIAAFDIYGNAKLDYTGTVYFTSSDLDAVLPNDIDHQYTFTELDQGSHSFGGSGFELRSVTTNISGGQTITVNDDSAAVTTTSSPIEVTPDVIDHFTITSYPTSVTAGDNFSATVRALDQYNNIKTDYSGDIWFTTTDTNSSVVMPATVTSKHTMTQGNGGSFDNGQKSFSNFKLITVSAPAKTVTLKNGSGKPDVGPVSISVTPAAFSKFSLSDYPKSSDLANQWVTAGYTWDDASAGGSQAPYNVTVTALDAYDNVQPSFTGKVWFTLLDNGEGLIAQNHGSPLESFDYDFPYYANTADNFYQFTGEDAGVHQFNASDFVVNTASSIDPFELRVNTDLNNIYSSFNIQVKPASASSVTINFINPPNPFVYAVDTPLETAVNVTVLDAVGNIKTDYEGDIWFTSNDTSANLPYTQASPYHMTVMDSGSHSFAGAGFTFHNGGQRSITVTATKSSDNLEATSSIVTVAGHPPTNLEASAGHQQVTLSWQNPPDTGVHLVNIYQSETQGELGTKVATVSVTASTPGNPSFSQRVISGLTNGTTYYFTLRSVVTTPLDVEYESGSSSQVSAIPADIAPRDVTALEAANGRVSIEFKLRYTSDIYIEYYNPANQSWNSASSGNLSGDFGLSQPGSEALTTHTVTWLARGDFPNKYFTEQGGFMIRVKAVVSGGTAYANSTPLLLDTKPPADTSLIINASGGNSADLTIAAQDDSTPMQMMIANEPTFAEKQYQAYATSLTGFPIGESNVLYIRFKDAYSNTIDISKNITSVIQGFRLKDNSDLRTDEYMLLTTWQAFNSSDVDKYIVERQIDGGSFEEVSRTNQIAYLDIELNKETMYGYRVKVLMRNGDISRPSETLSSRPGLAPDISDNPKVEIFGYKQDVGVKVIVHWQTDQFSDSFVSFSTENLSNGQNTTTATGETANIIGQLDYTSNHTVTITNLLPGKKYSMKVLSQNDQKITGYSNVFSVDTPAYTPLQIQSLEFVDLRPDSVWVQWKTNKLSKTDLFYGLNGSFDKTLKDTELNSDHKFKIDNLSAGQQYALKISAVDEDGNIVDSDEYKLDPPAEPIVSNLSVKDISNSSATVSWDTNINADSNVEYGITSSYGAQSGKSDSTTRHSVSISGLEANTLYHIKAKSKDVYNNEAPSGDFSFTTISDTTAPKLDEIQSQLAQVNSTQGVQYQAIISWKTDEGSTSLIEYGDNAIGQYSKKTQEDMSLNMTHVVILSNLKPNSAYSFRVISRDKSNNEARSTNYTVITPPQERSLTQIVINSLSETFSWVGKLRAKWFKK